MKIIGGILFVVGVLFFIAYFVNVKSADTNTALFGCLLMPGGILLGYLGSKIGKPKVQ